MRVLIDTHYVLWAAINSKRMETWARKLIADLDNEILVSAASVYEISLKVRRGKLPEAVEFESDLIANIESRLGYTLLPLEAESMMRAARFEYPHADPSHDCSAGYPEQLARSQHRSQSRCFWRSTPEETQKVVEQVSVQMSVMWRRAE